MRKKKYIWVIGLIALLINIISVYFFLNRDKFGNYTKQVSYKELYSTTANTPAVLKKWKEIFDQYPETQVREGRELSREKAGLVDKEPELNRIIKIGNWLKKSFAKCAIGRPTRAFDSLTYTEQYKSAANAETPVWCGTYANLFQFFCTINDITCRMIESFGPGDNHVVNESYLPATGEWVFTDLSHDVIYCKDKTGQILNTIDLLNLNVNKDSSSITAYTSSDSGRAPLDREMSADTWKDYLGADNRLYYYYKTDVLTYTFREKIARYMSRAPRHETFSLTPISNQAFYLRTFLLYTGILTLAIFLFLYNKYK